MNINEEIQKITDVVIEEKLPKMVEDAVTTMLTEIIANIFREYGDTSKRIKTKIESQLDVNLQEFDLVDYNALIAKTINDNIIQQVNLEPILKLTKNTLGFVDKKTIKLSEIVEMFIETAQEDSNDSEGSISLFVELDNVHKWVEVYIDLEEDLNKEECGIKFLISENSKHIFSFHSKDYWTKLNPITPSKLCSLNNLEAKIYRLYSAQVNIEIDELDFENSWSKY